MEEKICTHKSTDCKLESIDTLEKYYSVEFSLNSKGPAYIFKLRDISLNCPSILVKEDSSVLKQLKVGDILNVEYNSPESLVPTKLLKTQITSKNYGRNLQKQLSEAVTPQNKIEKARNATVTIKTALATKLLEIKSVRIVIHS